MRFQKVFLAVFVSCISLLYEFDAYHNHATEAFSCVSIGVRSYEYLLHKNAAGKGIGLDSTPVLIRKLSPLSSIAVSDLVTSDSERVTKHDSEEFGISLTPLYEVTDKLHQILNKEEVNQTVATVGYITHKRTFGSALAFIDLVETNHDPDAYTNSEDEKVGLLPPPPLQALLKRQAYNHDESKSAFSSILKSIHPGTKVYLEGFASPTKNVGEVVLLVSHLKFLKSSRNPEHIKGMLQRFNLDHDHNNQKKSDGIKDKTGLAFDEFDTGVFGPQVTSEKLKQVLLGHLDAESLFQSDSDDQEILIPHSITEKEKAKTKVPLKKIARLITDHLPVDEDYPAIILSIKGRDKGSSGQYNNLPPVPLHLKKVPSIVLDSRQTLLESNDNLVEQEFTTNQILAGIMSNSWDKVGSHRLKYVSTSGWVQNRRRFNSDSMHSIAVLELVDDLSSANESGSEQSNRLKCILHPDFMNREPDSTKERDSMLPSDVYGHLASKGSRIALEGFCIYNNDGDGPRRPFFWVTEARLQRSSWRPAVLRFFLDVISGKSNDIGKYKFDVEEIGDALDMGHSEAIMLVEECQSKGTTERQWRAAELSRKLQDTNSRMGTFSNEMEQVLNNYSTLRETYTLEHVEYNESPEQLNMIPMRRRKGNDLRKSAEGSRWRRKKKPQVEWMVNQIKRVVESHPEFGSRPLNILDVGGGRGHLANHVASALGNNIVNVHVIDIDNRAVKNGITDAKRKDVKVTYGVGDASRSSNIADLLQNGGESMFDVVIALHACGALSDVALGHVVVNKAAFVITPCCFRSNPDLMITIPSTVSDNKDSLTNSSVPDKIETVRPSTWLGMEEDSLLALTQACEIQGDMNVAGEAIHTLCALRAKAVMNQFRKNPAYNLNVGLKTFPIGLSTRNFCIVGELK